MTIRPSLCRAAPSGGTIEPVEREDVTAIIGALFDINVKLARVVELLVAIRSLLGEEPDEEETEGN